GLGDLLPLDVAIPELRAPAPPSPPTGQNGGEGSVTGGGGSVTGGPGSVTGAPNDAESTAMGGGNAADSTGAAPMGPDAPLRRYGATSHDSPASLGSGDDSPGVPPRAATRPAEVAPHRPRGVVLVGVVLVAVEVEDADVHDGDLVAVEVA